jgi:hypothetical protein
MSDVWYYAEGDKSVGPLTLSELKTILSRVSDARDVLVWRDGFSSWQTAKIVPELAPVVIKPPLPPPPLQPRLLSPVPPPDRSFVVSASPKRKKFRIGTIIFVLLMGGVFSFIDYANEAAKKDDEAYEQCLKEHPLTAEQTAAKKHFTTCYEYQHMYSHVLSDNQLKMRLIGEGCYPDDRDDPLSDVAYAQNYCDLHRH